MLHPRERHLSRRDFLRRSAGATIAMPGLAAILEACTRPGTETEEFGFLIPRPDNPVTLPLMGEPISTDTPIETGADLQIYNWVDYVWKYVVRRFVDQHKAEDITFQAVTTFNNMDEAVAKMQTGQIEADVFFPTYDVIPKLVAADLLQPLNHELIPNLEKHNWPTFQNPYYDQGWRYSVPYTVYTTGIGYRRDVISDDMIFGMDNAWEILWDPQYAGKVGVYDSYRETIYAALMKNGITEVNTSKQEDLDLARDELLAMIDAVNPRASINGAYKKLPQGEFVAHLAWSGDLAAGWGYVPDYTVDQYTTLGYWFPQDRRGNVDNDCMAIPKNAPHPRLAHEFINYMLDFENAMDNFSWVGYQPPQIGADPGTLTEAEGLYSKLSGWAEPAQYVLPWMEDAVVRQSDFDVGLRFAPLAPDVDERWHDVWQQFKAGVSAST